MRGWILRRIALALMLVPGPAPAQIDLAGTWRFAMDTSDSGVRQEWYRQVLPETVTLPGSMAENGKGFPVTVETRWYGGIVDRSWFTEPRFAPYREPGNVKVPFWLMPTKVYYGAAWYQRDVVVPESWKGRAVSLWLERCHWESTLWVDSLAIGSRNSLSVPHVYDLTGAMTPGRHTVTIRVDNRIGAIDIGRNAHSITDHTQTNWNGIIGRLELRSLPPVQIESLQVYPDFAARAFTVLLRLRNRTGRPQSGTLSVGVRPLTPAGTASLGDRFSRETIASDTLTVMRWYPLGGGAKAWDEFTPFLYQVSALWQGDSCRDEGSTVAGLREFKASGTRFTVNGRPVFLRGTLDWVLFPRTGYPSMTERGWEELLGVIRAHGLNHVRFHSWCPPEAAFAVADRLGLYLQIECGVWTRVGDGNPVDQWIYQESERIVEAYGNHPSFCMLAHGNEPSGERSSQYLSEFVRYWKARDRRRVYTSGAGWPVIPESDFVSIMEPRIQVWGMGLTSLINGTRPGTDFDFRAIVGQHDRPVVAHETGQWCVYPDFREIPKYDGVLRAGNFEIFQEDLQRRGLGHLAGPFVQASGKLQALCYKADIEAALRTPGMAGFQLLGLHDFSGQGTALVGILNPFSEGKGYVTAEEFRRFCSPTVPLARMGRFSYRSDETLTARLEVAHFAQKPLTGSVASWRVTDTAGTVVARGRGRRCGTAWGNAIPVGEISIDLRSFRAPGQYRLSVVVGEGENSWDFWVYPATVPEVDPTSVLVTARLDRQAVQRLERGGNVLLTLPVGSLRRDRGGDIALGFSSIFWNTAWTGRQPPHTLGLILNGHHEAFAAFPTENHSNYQWWDAVTHARAMVIDDLEVGEPLIRVIDDWFTNRSLALAFEAKVENGQMIVCSIDLLREVEGRPEARQLLHSLSRYMQGPSFYPVARLELRAIRALLVDGAER